MIWKTFSSEFYRTALLVRRSPTETAMSLGILTALLVAGMSGAAMLPSSSPGDMTVFLFIAWIAVASLISGTAADLREEIINHTLPGLAVSPVPLASIIYARTLSNGLFGLIYGIAVAWVVTSVLKTPFSACGMPAISLASAFLAAWGVGAVVGCAALMFEKASVVASSASFLLLPVLLVGGSSISSSQPTGTTCGVEGENPLILVAALALLTVSTILVPLQLKAARRLGVFR